MRSRLSVLALAALLTACWPGTLDAHPIVENALDVVIGRGRIVITARIATEQITVVEAGGASEIPAGRLASLLQKHAGYVRDHLHLSVGGHDLAASSARLLDRPASSEPGSSLVPYEIDYPLTEPPTGVLIEQNFLREFPLWSASCILRIRQDNQPQWDTVLLTREQTAEFGCDWSQPTTAPIAASKTDVKLGPTIRAYVAHGIMHILTGYDHMLFITALVLATTKLWDLVKVVTAFTLAHTITLALSVFNILVLSERIVEPMIALSIIFVAVQNVFWPERSRGWSRLAVAFAFGLFHGLGFAGGLKEAMSGMPGVALWAALISFSLGVEIAHQMVVIPLYVALSAAREWKTNEPRVTLATRTRQIGSAGISLAGIYFLVQAITM